MNINKGRNKRNEETAKYASMCDKPWPPKDILIAAFESLVNWYTVDEIAMFFGRTRYATGRKISALKVKVRWRKNHKGSARMWQKGERALLTAESSQSKTQREVAEKLGVSRYAVVFKWSKIGSKWGQGYISLSDIARIAGCTASAVSKRVKDSLPHIARLQQGRGKGSRYRLSVDQAEEVMAKVRPGRVYFIRQIYGD